MPEIIYEKKGRVAYITLNRPEKRNTISSAVARELGRIWVDFRDDDELWVAILSGAGKCFCAGFEMEKKGDRWSFKFSESRIFGNEKMGPGSYDVWKPIIAAVHGYAYGAGLWLALDCDLIVAADDALFGAPEPQHGLATSFSGFMPRFMPGAIANELLLAGDPIDAHRAYQIGMVNKVVPRQELMNAAEKMGQRLCQNAPLALRAMKEPLRRSRGITGDRELLALTEPIITKAMNSEDAGEGIRAFLERRKPIWKAR